MKIPQFPKNFAVNFWIKKKKRKIDTARPQRVTNLSSSMGVSVLLFLLPVAAYLPSATTGLIIPQPPIKLAGRNRIAIGRVRFESDTSLRYDLKNTGKTRNGLPHIQTKHGRKQYRQMLGTRLLLRMVVMAFGGTLLCTSVPAWASDGILAPPKLGARNLFAASIMLSTIGGLGLARIIGFSGLSRNLIVSASRAAAQLYLLGCFLLQRIMGTSRPWFVALWIVGVGLAAGRESFARVKYSYPRMKVHVYLTVLVGGLSILAMAVGFQVFGFVDPWYEPRTLIPVAGMLFGNSLSAAALGASTITQQFAVHQADVELRLARGATCHEATYPIIQQSLKTALTPTINGLAVTGLVHIPGMMTGQILAGQSAPQAAAYQAVISFLIATTACLTVQLLIQVVSNRLMDVRRHRLRITDLIPASKLETSTSEALSDAMVKIRHRISMANNSNKGGQKGMRAEHEDNRIDPVQIIYHRPYRELNSTDVILTDAPVVELEVHKLQIRRLNTTATFIVRSGDRIGITGRSGVGKSQILRSLIGLEMQDDPDEGEFPILLDGLRPEDLPKYRTEVCLVPQSRPNLEGTPRMFYEEIRSFQRQRRRHDAHQLEITPMEIAKQWNLPLTAFDRPWSTLSGGEVQRASLAIALATKPRVLLLDESTSALDEKTCRLVEKTLIESRIPILVVTHNKEQQDRFCNHKMELV